MDKSSSPVDPTDSPHAYLSNVEQSGVISDPALNHLRDHIKKTLIPTLIKIFQLKLELNQALGPPSRLYPSKMPIDADPIMKQLSSLDEDLNTLIRWCESCKSHIAKAVGPHEDSLKKRVTSHPTDLKEDAVLRKSFSSAVSSQFQIAKNPHFFNTHLFSQSLKDSKKKWWKWLKAMLSLKS